MKFNGKTLSVAAEFSGGGEAYYDEFWDTVQENGERIDYSYSFCHSTWTDAIFKPKYDIKPERANYMFTQSAITDLKAALDRVGKKLDFSNVKAIGYLIRPFDGSQITRIGVVDIAHLSPINTLFTGAAELQTIELLRVDKYGATQFGANMFQNCAKLQNITIDGTLDTNIDMSMCPLSVESMKSVISHLKNLAGEDYTRTIKLSRDCWNRLDAEGGEPPYGDDWWDYLHTVLCWQGESAA